MNYSFYFSVWLKIFLRQCLKTITYDALTESSYRHSSKCTQQNMALSTQFHPPLPILFKQMGPLVTWPHCPLTSIRAPFSLSSDRLALSNSSCISESWSWRSLISVWCCSRSIFTWNSLAEKQAHQRDSPRLCFFPSSLISDLQMIKQSHLKPQGASYSVSCWTKKSQTRKGIGKNPFLQAIFPTRRH